MLGAAEAAGAVLVLGLLAAVGEAVFVAPVMPVIGPTGVILGDAGPVGTLGAAGVVTGVPTGPGNTGVFIGAVGPFSSKGLLNGVEAGKTAFSSLFAVSNAVA